MKNKIKPLLECVCALILSGLLVFISSCHNRLAELVLAIGIIAIVLPYIDRIYLPLKFCCGAICLTTVFLFFNFNIDIEPLEAFSVIAITLLVSHFFAVRYNQGTIGENKKFFLLLNLTILFAALFFIASSFIHRDFLRTLRTRNPKTTTAYWANSRWGISQKYNMALDIRSQYSYDKILQFLAADEIYSVENLTNYSDFWIVTPTKPFTRDEILLIKDWVKSGGRLFVITDHTDLFGHSTNLSGLLSQFDLKSVNNCILDPDGREYTYWNLWRKYNGLTANSFSGSGEPWLFQVGFSERTDYSQNSFFSDNQVSEEDNFGIHAIGIKKGFGLGTITLMGDSTLFANFAMAWPSSQELLLETISSGRSFSIYFIAGIVFFLVLAVRIDKHLSYIAGLIVTLLLGEYIYVRVNNAGALALSKNDVRINIDRDSVDKGRYHTIFASAYYSSVFFPIFVADGVASSTSTSIDLNKNFSSGSYVNISDYKAFNIVPSCSCDEYLNFLITDSSHAEFWFNTGVGYLRELAYKRFWALTFNTQMDYKTSLADARAATATVIESGKKTYNVPITYRRVCTDNGWVIVGNWICGQWVNESTIFISKDWQNTQWRHSDIVLIIQNEQVPQGEQEDSRRTKSKSR